MTQPDVPSSPAQVPGTDVPSPPSQSTVKMSVAVNQPPVIQFTRGQLSFGLFIFVGTIALLALGFWNKVEAFRPAPEVRIERVLMISDDECSIIMGDFDSLCAAYTELRADLKKEQAEVLYLRMENIMALAELRRHKIAFPSFYQEPMQFRVLHEPMDMDTAETIFDLKGGTQ